MRVFHTVLCLCVTLLVIGCAETGVQQSPQPAELANLYNSRGLTQAANRSYDAAIADYDRALEQVPDYRPALYNRAIAYGKKRDFDRAIADYDHAIVVDPNHSAQYFGRAYAYSQKRDLDHAIGLMTQNG